MNVQQANQGPAAGQDLQFPQKAPQPVPSSRFALCIIEIKCADLNSLSQQLQILLPPEQANFNG